MAEEHEAQKRRAARVAAERVRAQAEETARLKALGLDPAAQLVFHEHDLSVVGQTAGLFDRSQNSPRSPNLIEIQILQAVWGRFARFA